MTATAENYVLDGGWQKIPGATGFANLDHLLRFGRFQEQLGVAGDVAEIGVFKGMFFTLLHLLTRADENAIAIDVFEDLDSNFDKSGGTAATEELMKNVAQFVDKAGLERTCLIRGDSLYLNADAIRKEMRHSGLRLFSIDGAHSWFHTANDLQLADSLVCPGGIVILDDITNGGWPGVMDGLARFLLLSASRKLSPFMIGHNKVWLTTPDYHDRYLEFAWTPSVTISPRERKRRSQFFGSTVVGF